MEIKRIINNQEQTIELTDEEIKNIASEYAIELLLKRLQKEVDEYRKEKEKESCDEQINSIIDMYNDDIDNNNNDNDDEFTEDDVADIIIEYTEDDNANN